MTTKHPGGTFRRLKTPRYATPGRHQQANITTTALCPVCHERRNVVRGLIMPHQRSRDERGAAIFPAVPCAGAGLRGLASGAGAQVQGIEYER